MKKISPGLKILMMSGLCLGFTATGSAQEGTPPTADDLAKQLSNPVASLISVPFQFNLDFGGGIEDAGRKGTLNIQPVIPMSVGENWNVISRTILPLISQEDMIDDGSLTQSGLGDVVQSFFLSPKQSDPIWGVGPVFLVPTATEKVLGAEQFAAGPTAVLLQQAGLWTRGCLINHMWSIDGETDRADVSATFLQPFISKSLGGGATATLNLESTYDWNTDQWIVPVNAVYGKVFSLGDQLLQWNAGARYYAEAPDTVPDWGLRLVVTLLFPK